MGADSGVLYGIFNKFLADPYILLQRNDISIALLGLSYHLNCWPKISWVTAEISDP